MANINLKTATLFNGIITDGKYANRQLPRIRKLNNDNRDDFVAIDFETMTRYGSSACAIGMVKVIDAHIVDSYYSIINPVRDDYTDSEPNFNIHGLSLVECEKALTFEEQFEHIKNFIGNWKILCHNASADINILNECMEIWGLSGINTSFENIIDTYAITKKSLKNLCLEFNIDLPSHHNALCDAEATAKAYLHIIGKPIIDYSSDNFFKDKRRTVSSEHRGFIEKEDCISTESIFNNKKVVITGTFEKYPLRDNLAALIQKLGGRVTSGISNATNIVILGNGAGPSKLNKIEDLKALGQDILIICESELHTHLEPYIN